MDDEPGVSSHSGGGLIQFEPFYLKPILGIHPQATAFVTANVKKATGTYR
ncbi:MAG TPA: hypothetical protein VMF66_01290 [Candidatus Acidoferrum sp.]|nr:hypothetical protein [Candidatus Acidoferrum sp.]